jgi:hypothetical protein
MPSRLSLKLSKDLPFARGEDVGMGRAAASGAFGGHCEISVGLVVGELHWSLAAVVGCQSSVVSRYWWRIWA